MQLLSWNNFLEQLDDLWCCVQRNDMRLTPDLLDLAEAHCDGFAASEKHAAWSPFSNSIIIMT